jgi:predicted NUDIX family NTP pyrophosphohydrolase
MQECVYLSMVKQSAGILAYRKRNKELEVLLVHPGGPFFAKKDNGAWSIPKGEFTTEDPLAAAKREFEEELGIQIEGQFIPLNPVTQKGGKVVFAWAIEADIDVAQFKSNTFSIVWPPKSGQMRTFPEVDKAEWFSVTEAREKINEAQINFINEVGKLFGEL